MAKSSKMKPRHVSPGDVDLGKRIRIRRVEQNISQAELGEKLGVSFQQVQKYEKGVNRVTFVRLEQIAKALDVPVTFFNSNGNAKQTEVESLMFGDPAYKLRLLRAYDAIEDQVVQRHFVTLMESVASSSE
jgi:transcriptional regulator with XRE-family HTH domain